MKIVIVNGDTGETIERDMTPEEVSEREAIDAQMAEEEANRPYAIQKMLLWTRLSDEDAAIVDAAMAAQPARMRGIWNSATEVRSDSEFFGTLQAFLTAVLGPDRTADLLRRE